MKCPHKNSIKDGVCNANAELEEEEEEQDQPEDGKPKAKSGSGSSTSSKLKKVKKAGQFAMHESNSDSEDEDQGGLEEFVFFQNKKNAKDQECNEASHDKLKSNATAKTQGHLLQTHKSKTRQDDVTTTP